MLLSGPELATFMLATLAVMATPGVTVTAITGATLGQGIGAGLGMELGAALARVSMLAVLALGLGTVAATVAALFDWIKLAGAAYLIWLGIQAIRHPVTLTAAATRPKPLPRQVLNGFIVLWSNPKAIIFFGAFVPQFVRLDAPIVPQIGFLGLIWIVTAALTDGSWVLVAGGARRAMASTWGRRLGWVSGLALIGAGVWLALQRKA